MDDNGGASTSAPSTFRPQVSIVLLLIVLQKECHQLILIYIRSSVCIQNGIFECVNCFFW
ncbi:unnamed protein product [Acanthoscelides obtectus]|uniref:Uncharacterized protein n=1 Tax=Acanthoscelides obtectus TaxID=200917 RepID=A0A9P0KIV4_ACAOB|nr:unnamed protein product [Acanthoscelides obtectus]CAK1646948.1 hypothetical protein AOBTE_LOCUS14967 [Acanthoscelides obtectus]